MTYGDAFVLWIVVSAVFTAALALVWPRERAR